MIRRISCYALADRRKPCHNTRNTTVLLKVMEQHGALTVMSDRIELAVINVLNI